MELMSARQAAKALRGNGLTADIDTITDDYSPAAASSFTEKIG